MFQAFTCMSQQHDWRFVALAGFVCCLSGVAAIRLLRRARSSAGIQPRWLATAGLSTGCGIWATHFIGMLAYRPGMDVAFDIPLTMLSLVAAIGVSTIGFYVALGASSRFAAPIGGAIVGFGIAAMHYIGIAALEAPATLSLSAPLVVTSIILAVGLGAAALTIADRKGTLARDAAAATLCLAILTLHFTAMSAAVLVADPTRVVGDFVISGSTLALAIAGTTIGVLGMGITAAFYDSSLAARAEHFESARRELTAFSERRLHARNIQLDAALNNMSQALCMFNSKGQLIVCNDLYARLFELPTELSEPGTRIEDILAHKIAHGLFQGESADAYRRERLATLARNQPQRSMVEFRDGRVFSVWHQPMAEGGWVATHEDITESTQAQRELSRLYATVEDAKSRAEHAAAQAMAAHQQLIEASNVMAEGFVLLDAEDRHVVWNERYAAMMGEVRDALVVGAPFEDMVRLGVKKAIYADDAMRGVDWVARRMAGHRLPENSFEMRLPGDRWFRVDERRTADGGSVGVRVDITELKRREASLRLLFMANPLPMVIFDTETLAIVDVNDAAVIHYGWSREQFLAMSISDLRPAEDPEKLTRVSRSPDGWVLNGAVRRHRKANGEAIEVAIHSRLLDHEGRPAALVAIVDITQAHRAEAELASTREFLDSVVESVPTAIIVKDARTFQTILVNRAAETFLGVSRDEIIDRTAVEVYSPEGAALVREQDRHLLENRHEVFSNEQPFETPGNGRRWATTKRRPIFDERGEPLYLLTVIDDVTDRRLASERIAHLTSHDILTGLPNRTVFGDRLIEALDSAGPKGVAVLCIDLDRFKDVNDVFGHALADRALSLAGRRIQEAAGEAFMARVGGDEFNLILTHVEQPEAVAAFAEKLLRAAIDEIDIGEQHVRVGFSIGIAIWPEDGANAAALVANAEAALVRAKSGGRGCVRFFEAGMESRLRESRALANDLTSAVELGQLRLHYQPQTDVAGKLLGFEALVRWQHPTRGLVPPGLFIPIAEEQGLIVEIGEWILREACREAASWPGDLSIAVNLSPIQFRQSDFFDLIRSVLVATSLPGHRLELEITEGVLIADTNAVLGVLRRAKALGARIAMDDFGTGYSSLYYLQSFPFDKIKIDRSFITDLDSNPQSAAIVRGVLGLAHGLNLPVIAEGVETEAQLAILVREGCDEIQGYLMGRPRPIEAYANWILHHEDGRLMCETAS